jgi:hypothetical protein
MARDFPRARDIFCPLALDRAASPGSGGHDRGKSAQVVMRVRRAEKKHLRACRRVFVVIL